MLNTEFFKTSGLASPGLLMAKLRISQSASAAKAVFVLAKHKAITDKMKILLAILRTPFSRDDSELNNF